MRTLASCILTLSLSIPLHAATLTIRVQDARGNGMTDAVIYALPEGRQLPLAQKTAVMDQKSRMFVPHVLAVQAGTSVSFPNSDDVRHHVYSFSPARTFQLPLYKGTPAAPLLFDRAGVVTLGCNIHDQMSAFIFVVDTPYFAKTVNGAATIDGVGAGRYTVHVWYPDMRDEPQPRTITVSGQERVGLTFAAGRAGNASP
jgi:plastocyanin